MKKLQTLLLALLTACFLVGFAFADVISGPVYTLMAAVPLICVGVIILVAILVIRAVARAAKRQRDVELRSDDMQCRHEDAESHAKKSSWDNRDPWD